MTHPAVSAPLPGVQPIATDDRVGQRALAIRLALDSVLENLGAACLTAIIVVVFSGVISRYAFNASFSWTEEGGLWLFTLLIFTVLPIATYRSKHIAINLLHDWLPPSGQALVRFLATAAITYTVIRLLVGRPGDCHDHLRAKHHPRHSVLVAIRLNSCLRRSPARLPGPGRVRDGRGPQDHASRDRGRSSRPGFSSTCSSLQGSKARNRPCSWPSRS